MSLHQATDGSYYSDTVNMVFFDTDSKEAIHFDCDPETLYRLVHSGLSAMATQSEQPDTSNDPNAETKKRVSRLVKAALKGGLLVWGNDLLTILFGNKDHPKPQKGEDILAWYMATFTRIGIAYLLKQHIELEGVRKTDDPSARYTVNTVATRPYSSGMATKESLPTTA